MATDLSDSPTSFTDPDLKWSDETSGADSPTAVTPSTDDATDSPPASATTGSETTPREGASEAGQQSGPLPFERHKAILEAQRAESDAKWQRVSWAEELVNAGKTPDQIREALQIYDGVGADPVDFLNRFHQQLETHPQYAPQVRSWAARILGGHKGQGQPTPQATDAEPQPDFQDQATGTPIFSATRLREWHEWKARQDQATRDSDIAPLRDYVQKQQFTEQVKQVWTDEENRTKAELEDMRTKPHFKENEKDVRAFMEARQWKASLQDAYIHVLTTKILPTLSATEQAKTLTELKTQAAAGNSVNPRAGAAVVPASPKGFYDSNLKW